MQLCQIHKRQFKAMAPLYLEGGSFVGLGIHIALKFQRRTKEKNKTKDKGSQIHGEEEKMHYVFFFFFLTLSLSGLRILIMHFSLLVISIPSKSVTFTMDQSNHVFCVNKRFGLE